MKILGSIIVLLVPTYSIAVYIYLPMHERSLTKGPGSYGYSASDERYRTSWFAGRNRPHCHNEQYAQWKKHTHTKKKYR